VVASRDAVGPREVTGSAAISAFALESADPARSARRAAQLLARPLPRLREQAEADLTAVAAPDGTEVFFCRTEPIGAHGWLDDFLPTGEQPTGGLAASGQPLGGQPTGGQPTGGLAVGGDGAGVTGIDHLSLAQPFDRFDEAGLFYRTVLGLVDDEAGELAAPFGLIRTRAVRDASRRVRLVLSVPQLRRGGWAPGVPQPQHVTLATGDLLATAAAVRAAGAPLLPIPGNYYDDLAARLDLPADLLAALRDVGGMYDEDAHGRYLQLFTPVLGSRVFVELCQRIGGYRGYGTPNDPVRMAAHRAHRQHRPHAAARG
jgi:4-hydroxyphenylpyruvate dioxygenase